MSENMCMEINGKRYLFSCESWSTRSGFAHGCRMIDLENWRTVAEAKRYYLNRTWECYRFQSVIEDAISNAMADKRDDITADMKRRNGWEKLTAKRREMVNAACAADVGMGILKALVEEVGKVYPAWA